VFYNMTMKQSATAPEAANKNSFVPNKALGQNFLTDERVICTILDASGCTGKTVLEIGPGTGALTQGLLERAIRLYAVEKDGRLCELLAERFGERLTLLHADFLEADIGSLVQESTWHAVGNLPYYATTPIVLKLLSLLPESMTLMVQKEAAERFFAEPGDRVYGPLAVMTQCFYSAKKVLSVPRSCFTPSPEVDSTIVRLERNSMQEQNPAAFLAFLKQAFSMRRKTLYNSLMRDPRLPDALQACQISLDARAEALEADSLLRLYRRLEAMGRA
ncbi:MAG TPA: 16S rRNA (adenine(1518)-N(6)/adenine(1519)-N(6))-dimethyltransferase RsmA, partial [Candidatus Cryosericum sp.]|nr:16S rRNA (adenine(1518)-N(6)/adenine(1519)-N(6))-dimethyltransferase RsmA [Candidatus Cryosericum sp.]